MKKLITIFVFLCLFFYFLVYCGVFRNNKDPVKVTEFYFQCMKDSEWMLTYPVIKPGYFDEYKLLKDKDTIFEKSKIRNMEFRLSSIKGSDAFVEVNLFFEGQQKIKSMVILERNSRNLWLIKDVSYN